jgi:RNA polymerase sigma-70 factor, ECF subfamily
VLRVSELASEFEALRPHMTRVAYGILGSLGEAEDVVQEAWLRLQRSQHLEIGDMRAWLTTVVGRLALDALGTARRRRETYVGEWLPEPVVDELGADPTLDEAVSTALLVVLEKLSPAERTAFLLHDVFELPFPQVAEVVGRSPAAVRQLAARARARVESGRPRFPASSEEEDRVAAAFALAWQEGDLEQLLMLLDPDAVLRADGGGRVPTAAKPLRGGRRIAQMLIGLARSSASAGRGGRGRLARVNGATGIVVEEGQTTSVYSLTLDRGRIVSIDVVRNPEKLRRLSGRSR